MIGIHGDRNQNQNTKGTFWGDGDVLSPDWGYWFHERIRIF